MDSNRGWIINVVIVVVIMIINIHGVATQSYANKSTRIPSPNTGITVSSHFPQSTHIFYGKYQELDSNDFNIFFVAYQSMMAYTYIQINVSHKTHRD